MINDYRKMKIRNKKTGIAQVPALEGYDLNNPGFQPWGSEYAKLQRFVV